MMSDHSESSNVDFEMVLMVQDSWDVVKTIPNVCQVAGELLFRNIFEIAPGAWALFPFGKGFDKVEDEMFLLPSFQQHAQNVVGMLDSAVHLLGPDLEILEETLIQLGANHVGYGVLPEHYPIVGEALIKTLATALDTKWTPDLEEAWGGVYGFVTTCMLKGANESLLRVSLEVYDSNSQEKRHMTLDECLASMLSDQKDLYFVTTEALNKLNFTPEDSTESSTQPEEEEPLFDLTPVTTQQPGPNDKSQKPPLPSLSTNDQYWSEQDAVMSLDVSFETRSSYRRTTSLDVSDITETRSQFDVRQPDRPPPLFELTSFTRPCRNTGEKKPPPLFNINVEKRKEDSSAPKKPAPLFDINPTNTNQEKQKPLFSITNPTSTPLAKDLVQPKPTPLFSIDPVVKKDTASWKLAQLRRLQNAGVTILEMTHTKADMTVTNFQKYLGRKLVNVLEEKELDLGFLEDDPVMEQQEKAAALKAATKGLKAEEAQDFCQWFQGVLGASKVQKCTPTCQFASQPARVIVEDLERNQLWQLDIPSQKHHHVEINPAHEVIREIQQAREKHPKIAILLAEHVYDLCLINAGLLDDCRGMINRMTEISLQLLRSKKIISVLLSKC